MAALTDQQKQSLEYIILALQHENKDVRAVSVQALGLIGTMDAVGPMLDLLSNGEETTRMIVWDALVQIRDKLLRQETPLTALKHALLQRQSSLAQTIIQALQDKRPAVREFAAWALGLMQEQQALESLLITLLDDNVTVRQAVAEALGQLREQSLPALLKMLQAPQAEIREMAAWTLGTIKNRAALPALMELIQDTDLEVRENVVWALGAIADKTALEGLLLALHDAHPRVREQAAWGLGNLEDNRAAAGLRQYINDPDPEVRERVEWALTTLEYAANP